MNTQVLARLKSPLREYPSRPLPGGWTQLELPPGTDLKLDARVLEVVPNHTLHIEAPPSWGSPPFGGATPGWSLERIHAPEAWQHATGRGAVVAVLDTGLDTAHPALQSCLWTNPGEVAGNGKDDDGNGIADDVHGCDAVNLTGDLTDTGEHGTHVSGIVAQVAPGARLMGVKMFDRYGNTDVASVIRGLDYAGRMGATIVNCSWGGAPFNQALYEAMRDCPALLVCSAGNTASDNDIVPHYPSGFELPNLLAVAATNRQDGLCFTSCYGEKSVDLGAPGEQILSTVPGGGFKVKSGTSQATPHVSGAAALLGPDSPAGLKERLTVDPVPGLKVASGGRLNAIPAKTGHGPHLLRDFYKDFQASWEDARRLDNGPEDRDPRPQRVDLGSEQAIVKPGELVIHQVEGREEVLVWLRGEQQGEHLTMVQEGWARDPSGCYAYPLRLEGPGDTPFDPPDAERVSRDEFDSACGRFQANWV